MFILEKHRICSTQEKPTVSLMQPLLNIQRQLHYINLSLVILTVLFIIVWLCQRQEANVRRLQYIKLSITGDVKLCLRQEIELSVFFCHLGL